MARRHAWIEKVRIAGDDFARCEVCGLVRMTVHRGYGVRPSPDYGWIDGVQLRWRGHAGACEPGNPGAAEGAAFGRPIPRGLAPNGY